MSIASFRWVLGCLCIELLLGLSPLAGSVPASSERHGLELELDLAERPEVYLVIDCGLRELQVKARGMVLHRTPILELALVRVPPSGAAAGIELPARWTVARTARGGYRRIIAPAAQDSGAAPAGEPATAPSDKPPVELEAATDYLVELSDRWMLKVGPESVGPRLIERWRWGWRALWRRGPDALPRPEIRLRLGPEDSRGLFHLLRPGVALMIVP